MGRHASGVVRSRLTATTVGIAVPVVLVVAAGSWWAVESSARSDSTASGSAVVVSSLACQNGDEGTVVDILDPAGRPPGSTWRATMDACGHREGEVLAVDYSVDDPGRVVPAAADSDGQAGQLMPLALVLAALLGVAAAVAVVRDGRRARVDAAAGTPARPGRHARPEEDEPPPADEVPRPEVDVGPSEFDLLFPPHDRLAASLHDELFTHRSPAGV